MSKPILFLVDGNPDDLRSLKEAVSGRYGSEYEVQTAATVHEARTALAAFAETGQTVALLIVSRDLDDCDPVSLLNQAQQSHPGAKRILTARYRDPAAFGVITAALRSGQIDYFINKPWEPRAERLYPVIDDLLATLRFAQRTPGFEAIRVVGRQWDPFSHKLRDILSRSTVPFGFYDSDSEEGKKILAEAGVDDSRLPVLVFFFGVVLVEPTLEQIVETMGARTRPEPGPYDVTVVGAGPAGLAAAVYAASEGLRTLILERETFGGQASASSHIDNYLGFPRGITGRDLARRAYDQACRFGAVMVFTKAVTGIHAKNGTRVITLSDGTEVESRTVVISTGVAYRRLNVPSLDRFIGMGVFYGAPMCEAQALAGEEVVIVGGGNSAGQAAVHLSRFAKQVRMVILEPALGTFMSDYLVRQIEAIPNIEVRCRTRVVEGHGDRRLYSVTIENPDGSQERVQAAGLFALVGGVPHTQWLSGAVERDAQGYIRTGRDLTQLEHSSAQWPLEREPYFLETSIPGVFAAGDVRCHAVKRVASAVGEGATAVQLIHEYLRVG